MGRRETGDTVCECVCVCMCVCVPTPGFVQMFWFFKRLPVG